VKIEARHREQTYLIEIQENVREGYESTFMIRIETGQHSVETIEVGVLSRTERQWTVELNGKVEDFSVLGDRGEAVVNWRHRLFPIEVYSLRDRLRRKVTELETTDAITLKAQMPGKVVKVLLNEGDLVEAGEGLVIIEAMKMQNELRSPKSGTVLSCEVKEGDTVSAGQLLFRIE
jgi:biotin carboxyl carrier protein